MWENSSNPYSPLILSSRLPGQKFPDYNIREYIKRRAKQGFRESVEVKDKTQLDLLWNQSLEEMQVVRRQATVYDMYARKHTSIMDLSRGK